MTTEYYTHGGSPAQGSTGSSATIRSEFDSVEAGFAKLPTLTGNAGKSVRVNATATGLEAYTASAADIAGDTHGATSKATPIDTDEMPLVDSAAAYGLKKLTWSNLKATLKTYLDTLYAAKGANSDITSLSALSTALSVGQGGTGATTASAARTSLGAAASGANSDITSLSGITSINGGQLAGMRNRIINGDMRIDQRNSGAAVTPSATGNLTYIVDRFAHYANVASKLTYQQVADAPAGFKFSTKITVASQYAPAIADNFQYYYAVEGQNIVDLGFGTASPATITVSLWVKGSVAGTYSVSLRNDAANRSYVGTVSVTASWAKQTITLTADGTGTWATDNTAGLWLAFDLGSGSNYNASAGSWQAGYFKRTAGSVTFVNQTAGATLNITGVQLEVGSTATPFEQRPYGLELALCQRYYYRYKPVSGGYYGPASVFATGQALVLVKFPVSMRTAPSALEQSGTIADYSVVISGATQICDSVPTFNSTTTETALVNFLKTAGFTLGQAGMGFNQSSATSYLGWSAEL